MGGSATPTPRGYPLTGTLFERLGRAGLVDELLRFKVALDARNGDGNNALALGCVSNDVAVVQRPIAPGIAQDNCNDMDATGLMYGAASGEAALVALLLQAGADSLLCNLDDAKGSDLAASRECLTQPRHTTD
jgi:ankyrin repeat protein